MISLLLVIFPIVLGDLTFFPWSFGPGWTKIAYAGPGTDAMDLAWRAARVQGINQNLGNPLMPIQVVKAQQNGLHIQLEAVYVEANCVGVNTPGSSNIPTSFEFVVNTKCYQRPLGRRYLYRVSEDISPDLPADAQKIRAWKVRDVRQYEIVKNA